MRLSRISLRVAGPLYKEEKKAFNIFQRAVEDSFTHEEIKNLRKEGAILKDSNGNITYLTLHHVGGEPTVEVGFTDPHHSFETVNPQLSSASMRFLRKISEFVSYLTQKGFYVNYAPAEKNDVKGGGWARPSDRRESIYQKELTRKGIEPYLGRGAPATPENLHWGAYPHGNEKFQSQKEIYKAFIQVKRWINRVMDKVSWKGIKDKNSFFSRLKKEAMFRLEKISGQQITDMNQWYGEIEHYIRAKVNEAVSLHE